MKYRNISIHTLSISHFPYSTLTGLQGRGIKRPIQEETKQHWQDTHQSERSSRGFSYISRMNEKILSHQTKTSKSSIKKLFRGTIVDHFYTLFTTPMR